MSDKCQASDCYALAEEQDYQPDYSKFDEDSVPPPEKEIRHTHPGRPDLDYDDTPVGPADGVEYVQEEHHQHKHQNPEEEEQ